MTYQTVILSNFCAHAWNGNPYLNTDRVSLFLFSRSFTAYPIVTIVYLLRSALEVIENLRSFTRRSVSIYVNFLEDMLITLFICYVSSIFCHVLLNTFLKRNIGKISVLVYRKPNYTEKYLHCYSHYQTTCKEISVYSLFNREYITIENKDDLTKENPRIKHMLKQNGYQESILVKF